MRVADHAALSPWHVALAVVTRTVSE